MNDEWEHLSGLVLYGLNNFESFYPRQYLKEARKTHDLFCFLFLIYYYYHFLMLYNHC